MFRSEQKKMRRHAENWLRLSEKVYHYRQDLLKEKELQELVGASTHLRETLRRKEDASKLKLAIERTEDVLRKYGGPYYRRSSWTDNVEVLLVAAILAIGIRTYFVQPFKIPTNSMWPSYYGMTHELFTEPEERPGPAAGLARRVFLGARRHAIEAPADGEVRLMVRLPPDERLRARIPRVDFVPARKWLILPGMAARYQIWVGNEAVAVDVPVDFEQQVNAIFQEAFFSDPRAFDTAVVQEWRRQNASPGDVIAVATGRQVQRGETILEFDVLTGDQLFVDRMSYHFVRPKVGDGFVFRTGEIPAIPEDKYYIKRLVGLPNDTLQIEPPVLLRNGEPISGRPVFEKMNRREDPFTGYVHSGMLGPERLVRLPDNAFFAMGDNSPNSMDSREFGFVPESEVVGRALFIYYPFSKRWGPAR